jgi:hypothetical protein
VSYSPLVYATGRVSAAPHYHRDRGGVYFYVVTDSLAFLDALIEHAGWIATIDPLGTTTVDPGGDYGTGRAEAVLVTSIAAWCQSNELDGHEYPELPHGTHRIDEGLLYHYPGYRRGWDVLLPLCGHEEIDSEDASLCHALPVYCFLCYVC